MSRRNNYRLVLLVLLILALSGCNLPRSTPTPFVFPTPFETPHIRTNTPPFPLPTGTLVPTQPLLVTETFLPIVTETGQPPASTATPNPSPNSTGTPLSRTGVDATFLSSPPSIDGSWDEWTTTQYPITNVVFGRANWAGATDLQASFRVGWDNNYLYLAVKVFDETYMQNVSGANLFKGDSIEVLLSTNPGADRSDLGLTASDYQVGISPGRPAIGQNYEAYLWYPLAKEGSLTNVFIGAIPMSGGYRDEFAIPWSVFDVTPSRDQVFGFAVSVSDNDDQQQNVQQTMISDAPRRNLADPTTWGMMTLK